MRERALIKGGQSQAHREVTRRIASPTVLGAAPSAARRTRMSPALLCFLVLRGRLGCRHYRAACAMRCPTRRRFCTDQIAARPKGTLLVQIRSSGVITGTQLHKSRLPVPVAGQLKGQVIAP